jgi:alpha-beta hydrolase superfamily lysophospholipase
VRWGVRTLNNRYRKAAVRNVSHDSYEGGRHKMLNELNRGKVRASVLAWLSAVLGNQSPHKEPL